MKNSVAADGARKGRGRPRAFDREAVLERAAHLFARAGYEGASIALLTESMRITPQSLYAAFGSKDALYRDALDWYTRHDGAPTIRLLHEEPDAITAFTAMFDEAAARFSDPDAPAGCMISIGALACGPEHASVVAHLAAFRNGGIVLFEERLRKGVADGQLSDAIDAGAMARFMGAILQGMAVQARDGAGADALRGIARQAIATLSLYRV